jgi:hypothetical protein
MLFDVLQARCTVGFTVNHSPASWNIGEGRPQAVLLLVVHQDEKAAVVVVEWIDAHNSPGCLVDMSGTAPNDS